MYDCDKGYILSERGPIGATCVGGTWRPTELPECLLAQHPRFRVTRRRRRKRSLQQNSSRIEPILNYRQLKRKIDELLKNNAHRYDIENIMRSRRSIQSYHLKRPFYQSHYGINKDWEEIEDALKRFKRNELYYNEYNRPRAIGQRIHRNHYDEELDIRDREASYMKFFEKIKQKHRNYISNLLRAAHLNANSSDPFIHEQSSKHLSLSRFAGDDSEPYKNQDKITDSHSSSNSFGPLPIALPNINENMNRFHNTRKISIPQPFINNTYVGSHWYNNFNQNNEQIHDNNFLSHRNLHNRRNTTEDVITQLASQLQRKKRNADDTKDETADAKKARSREPCEVSTSQK